jgi:hypothetical protein
VVFKLPEMQVSPLNEVKVALDFNFAVHQTANDQANGAKFSLV